MTAPLPFDKPAVEPTIKIYHGDCLEVMPTLAPKSVQCVFADLPYGILHWKKWDVMLDMKVLWRCFAHACSKDAAKIFTANMKFATQLIGSNIKDFRYDLVFEKKLCSNPLLAKKRPLNVHEHVLIFGNKIKYNAQMRDESYRVNLRKDDKWTQQIPAANKFFETAAWTRTRLKGPMYPRSVLSGFSEHKVKGIHPTQKPVALLEWLIRTYTEPGDTVLDPVFGSCTTGVACLNTGRNFVGIEKDATYFEVGRKRIAEEQAKLGFKVTV